MKPDLRTTSQFGLMGIIYLGIIFFILLPARPLNSATLPIKQKDLQVVAMFNAWTIWWNAESMANGEPNYWNAPIFHSEELSFAYSEPQPATMIVAPLLWTGNSPACAYNFYLYLSLFLNAFATLVFVRERSRSVMVGFIAGTLLLFLPLVHAYLDVLQLVPIWAIVWTWSSINNLTKRPSVVRGILTGLAFGGVCLISLHQALMMSILLCFTGWILVPKKFTLKFVGFSILALGVAAIMAWPFAQAVQKAATLHHFERDRELVQNLSATPSSYLSLPGNPLIHDNPTDRSPREHLGVGWVKTMLAVMAICLMLKRQKWDRWILFLTLTCLVSFCLSLGPNLQIGFWQPWQLLTDWFPGFAQVRSVFRYAYFVQISLVLLAVEGFRMLWLANHHPQRSLTRRRVVRVILSVLVVAAVLETYPTQPVLAGVPTWGTERSWIAFLKKETKADRSIACFPFAAGNRLSDFDITARWMYYGTMHGKPMVNGYSGFFPRSYFSLRKMIDERFPASEVLDELRERDVEFLVVLRSFASVSEILSDPKTANSLELVLEDPEGIDVYRLNPKP